MILIWSLQHACSGSLLNLKFQSLSALYCHEWARNQLILNHQRVRPRHGNANICLIHPFLIQGPGFSNLIAKRRMTCGRSVLVFTIEHCLVKGFDCDWWRLEIRLTQAKGNDVVACQVKHFADARWLYSQRSVTEVAHAFPFVR